MTRGRWLIVVAGLAMAAGGCGQQRDAAPDAAAGVKVEAEALTLREVFPGVRADARAGVVEFDAIVSPILVEDPKAPLVYLEVLACIPDTREHETLVVAKAKASHVHAALLAAGGRPGKPGGFAREAGGLKALAPEGDRVRVTFHVDASGGGERAINPLEWVVNARDRRGFLDSPVGAGAGWVFAGSRVVSTPGGEAYAGDFGGNIVGFSTFGDEVIALTTVLTPEAALLTPEWVADLSKTPPARTPVRVRLTLERVTGSR